MEVNEWLRLAETWSGTLKKKKTEEVCLRRAQLGSLLEIYIVCGSFELLSFHQYINDQCYMLNMTFPFPTQFACIFHGLGT